MANVSVSTIVTNWFTSSVAVSPVNIDNCVGSPINIDGNGEFLPILTVL